MMKRYRLFKFVNRAGTHDAKMVPDKDGLWVKYADVMEPESFLQALVLLEQDLKSAGIDMTISLKKRDD
jgi:hypothetical protein